ncbi:protein mono-ADP-ribosyltransferase PARP9 [Pimephales promelas]|uniref:protein mono-ADP-ribosyltransferase PARP9 n=1 Tax=Pimephales promelas TaxID=90988 RepID=UPI00195584F1|nr:protein mono-ADP-ribosyltransferase PARP9 [Pimephales promelas]XP_039511470.1 protein mono-ADP-ribosyltransferase PARP9 [Pimephales promelas]KAG1959852.1 protein mono-ADP-ribosyltransferase PARP9 [Pimephales promelas]KAG1959853.1 protein mono-ADP-ribosyltransferase PARP9 [Pimephales promelas]
MGDIQQIPLVPEHAAILRKCQSSFCQAVQAKFNCMAILHNIEASGSFGSTGHALRAEKRYSTKLSGEVEISVWKDDLTRHKVYAVVNAANENLKHGGGLAQALSDAGGPMIQKWSDDIIKQVGKVKTGEAVLSPAGNLPCNWIIHAVGPQVPQNPSQKVLDQAAPLLHFAIINILTIVSHQNIPSVAIPALSSGLFNFPRDRCADIIVKAIKHFQESRGFYGKSVEIHLVNNDEPSVQEMERATRAHLDPSNIIGSYSGAVQVHSMPSSSSNSLQFGNVTLHLKKGYIEEETVDVIVNTISTSCKLDQGEISKAILKKAGRKIQDEIYKTKMYTLFSTGVLYITRGHDLKCEAVYHTALEEMSYKSLKNAVTECLRRADGKYKSISFPAIGTGNLRFQKRDVAGIMTEAVAELGKDSTKKLDVYFVVFPKDSEMLEAFDNEMNRRKGQAKSPEARTDVTRFASASKVTTVNETATVEFQSSSGEALREAKEWTVKMLNLSKKRTIKNNHIIYLGQKDHEYLLSLQTMFDVQIEEFFRSGNGGITITGSPSDVSCVAIEVEFMLCKAQEDFAQAEERDMLYSVVRWSCKDEPWIQTPEISASLEKAYLAGAENHVVNNHKVSLRLRTLVGSTGRISTVERTCMFPFVKSLNNSFYERKNVTRNDYSLKDERKIFYACGLNIVKVEKLENIVLKQLFDSNERRVKDKPKRLYQRVSAQFCDLICRVGFQKEFAPPAEQRYGSGIYFSGTVDGALKLWREQEHEQYVYIIQAQVLTGKSTIGSPDLILPPAMKGDPLERYHSVSDRAQTCVIFSGQQALPEYLIICDKSTPV